MTETTTQVPLPMRSHTILGVCEAIGEDFGFNPILLRVPFAAIVLFSPLIAIGAYLALGLVVLGSRLVFPRAKSAIAEVPAAATQANSNSAEELSLAA